MAEKMAAICRHFPFEPFYLAHSPVKAFGKYFFVDVLFKHALNGFYSKGHAVLVGLICLRIVAVQLEFLFLCFKLPARIGIVPFKAACSARRRDVRATLF